MKAPKVLDDLRQLRGLTAARIGLARAGASIATSEMLKFELDQARARDAVHLPFDIEPLHRALQQRGLETLAVQSEARDRCLYLQRPDLGRRLNDISKTLLQRACAAQSGKSDLALILADGLSTRAVHDNALALLEAFLPLAAARQWTLAPVTVASQARVALADEIGQLLHARLSIILIGERPGLSAADSLGIYLTYAPRVGRSDAERNCISNIRAGGLNHPEAAHLLESLVATALSRRLSGVHLKEDRVLLEG